MAVLLLTNLIEGIAAYKRQQIDPTSEWGRYADKPAARGMALTLLLLKLLPYAVLPNILETFSRTIDRHTERRRRRIRARHTTP